MRAIPVSGTRFALVHDEDADFLLQWSWNFHILYARRNDSGRTVYMHRAIMQPPPDMVVDHVDGDGLDNRRTNLRVLTHTENLWNRRNKTGCVSWSARVGKWRTNISHRNRKYEIGFYDQREEAEEARAYVASVLRKGIAPDASLTDMPLRQ